MQDTLTHLIEIMRAQPSSAQTTIAPQIQLELLKLARQNKLALRLLASGAIAPEVADLRDERNLHHQKNAQVLALARQVTLALQAAQVRFLIFKGPIQQYVLYDSFIEKPSGDVDVLVKYGDFDVARTALESIGLSLPYECERIWWRYLLGEQHLVQSIANRPTVDLHHRLQRPGCPSPRQTSRFLIETIDVNLAGVSVPTLSRVATALLSTLNLIKALYDGEAAGGHMMDLSVALEKMDPSQRVALLRMAKEQGMFKSLLLASELAHHVFGSVNLRDQEDASTLDARMLSRLALDPNSGDRRHGRTLLGQLSDSLGDYARDATRNLVGKIARLID